MGAGLELRKSLLRAASARTIAGRVGHDQRRVDADHAVVGDEGLDRGQDARVVGLRGNVHEGAVVVDYGDARGLAFSPREVEPNEVHTATLPIAQPAVVSCVFVTIPNVLASRYASDEMVAIWSPEAKIVAERRLWLAVLRAQAELGVEVPEGVVEDYERVLDEVDLASIAARERVTRHDVKARIEEFNALAGHEHVHKGMTSRDLTENVEQLQIRRSLELVIRHGVAVVARLAERAEEYRDLVMAGRTHNVAAQATTLGKRFASAAEEMLVGADAGARADGPVPAARHQGPDGHRAGHARPVRRRPARLATWSDGSPNSWASRTFSPASDRCIRARWTTTWSPRWCRWRRPVVVGAHHPADGRPRTGDRGLPARAGRLVGDAAQDEHPLLRAGQRPAGGAARLRVDGRRTGRRAVERG